MHDIDIRRLPGSRIVEISRLAFATPDIDFLCFGESDQPSPTAAHEAARAALDAGITKYVDVRGVPPCARRSPSTSPASTSTPSPSPASRSPLRAWLP